MVEEIKTEELKTEELKSIVKSFRLKESEDAKFPELIEFAFRAGYLKRPSFQEFMVFCINCAYTRLKNEYAQRKGRP